MLYDGVTLSPTLVPDGPQEFQNVECPSYDIARSSYDVARSSNGIVRCRGYRLRWCPMSPCDDARDRTTAHDHSTIVVHDRMMKFVIILRCQDYINVTTSASEPAP